jgi:NTE family protein
LPGRRDSKIRTWNRTEAFARYLDEILFPNARLDRPTPPGRAVVLTATDLRTGAAVRFGSKVSSCSRYGSITDTVTLGTAVASSAAYPLLLPAVERRWIFTTSDGASRTETVMLSDGGIFDNLGLSVLQPGRSAAHTDHAYDVTHVISCDAGRGPLASRTRRFLIGRNARAFEIVHAQAQNHGRGRLHEWGASGALRGFVMAYLGQQDARLPVPVSDLVPAEAVAHYPTNFASMPSADFKALATRGEQLVRVLLPHYCPDLLR